MEVTLTRLTIDTRVAGLQVGHEFLGAGVKGVQVLVGHGHEAGGAARAARVQLGQDVGGAAGVPVVLLHASAEPHPSVPRHLHDYHVTRSAGDVHCLPLAVVLQQTVFWCEIRK